MGTILNMDACSDDQRRRVGALVRMYKAQGIPEDEAQRRAWIAMFDELSGGVPLMAQDVPVEASTGEDAEHSSEPAPKAQSKARGGKKAQREADAQIAATSRAREENARIESSKQPTDVGVLGLNME